MLSPRLTESVIMFPARVVSKYSQARTHRKRRISSGTRIPSLDTRSSQMSSSIELINPKAESVRRAAALQVISLVRSSDLN